MYGHHTYDFFMKRIDDHKELPADTHHMVEPGYENEQIEVKALETEGPKKPSQATFGPKNINELLDEQRDEAQAGPTGPDMDDLLDKEDIEELNKTPDEAPQPKAVDLKKEQVHYTPQVKQIGDSVEEVRNSIALKLVVSALALKLGSS